MTAAALDTLLQHPAIWRGTGCATPALPGMATGFAELDVVLPGGGWPAGAITEIHVERPGIGELKLLMPAAARITREGRWLALVAPPHIPYAPALAGAGVKLEHLMLVQAKTPAENLWACEQALRTGCCGAVLLWAGQIHERSVRRLQHAAESSGAALFMYRPARAAPATLATLRLHVSRSQSRTIVRVLKRRGGGLPAPVALDLHGGLFSSAGAARRVPTPLREPALLS